MKSFSFKKIDAFATSTSSGNPAGVISLNRRSDITDREMQWIARELKGFVSEVGYLWCNDDGSYGLRYFSSEREVEFCGHATIAILYDLIRNSDTLLKKEVGSIVTNKGRLEAENRIVSENAVFISAPDPIFSPAAIDKDRFAEAVRISPGEISDAYPVSVRRPLDTLKTLQQARDALHWGIIS